MPDQTLTSFPRLKLFRFPFGNTNGVVVVAPVGLRNDVTLVPKAVSWLNDFTFERFQPSSPSSRNIPKLYPRIASISKPCLKRASAPPVVVDGIVVKAVGRVPTTPVPGAAAAVPAAGV